MFYSDPVLFLSSSKWSLIMTKKNTFNKASLSKEALELFASVKKDIEETEKRIEEKRKRFEEVKRNGAIGTTHRFTL